MRQKRILGIVTFFLLVGAVFFVSSCQGNKDKKESVPTTGELAPSRPNILFIMSDDHAYQAISAYGSELSTLAPTPNIDRIAKGGALFTRMYDTNALCGPSRAVTLTGKHSHINGFRQIGERFDGNQPTLRSEERRVG